MKQVIIIASVATTDRLDKVYILLNSIKKNKNPDTKILYYLFIQYTSDYNKDYCDNYFSSIINQDFIIIQEDALKFKNAISYTQHSFVYFIRCLFPYYFLNLAKIMYLDVDTVVVKKDGIEDFWNLNIDNYYVGACIDPTWQYCSYYKSDLVNTGTKAYFNDGIMLLNLAKIREEGKDEEFKKWCLDWDDSKLKRICIDQTLVNYILKDKALIIPSKYNNSVLASLGVAKEAYNYNAKQEGYEDALSSVSDAVILHFCGANKPWGNGLYRSESEFPYKKKAIEIWNTICKEYGKLE